MINTARVLGSILIPFSTTMLPPLFVGLWYQEDTFFDFLFSTILTLFLGLILWFPGRKHHRDIHPREAFLIVVLVWVLLSLMGALPFIFSNNPSVSYVDALFETISGLTTTGATVIIGLDSLPKSILYYRQQLQFIGGGGIIVLSIAILPMLSVGGMQLFLAEMTGPFKEDKLTPRIAETAKTLWLIYVGLTVLCMLCFWAAGMDLFDAIGHSFSTISTGGFGTHDTNFEFFQNPLLEIIGTVFMLLGAMNFSLHFAAIRRRSLLHYWQDPELRMYLISWFSMLLLIIVTLFYYHIFKNIDEGFIKPLFQITSFITTTGFCSTNFNHWPTFIPVLLMLLCLIGGCAGSTAGGIKIIRLLILKMQGTREIKRLIHPSGHYIIKFGYSRLHSRTLEAILGFFVIFVAMFVVLLLVLLAMGFNFLDAFSTIACTISNTGLGLGPIADNFKALSDPAKVVVSIVMLAGRLELFTLLVLLSPNYWRY